ncbi:hypothetical protein ACWJJH_20915 [Endozoicomonadaceae bacterium StTr2]
MFRSDHCYLSAAKIIFFLFLTLPGSNVHSASFDLTKASYWHPTYDSNVQILCLRNQTIKGYGNIHSAKADLVLFPVSEEELRIILDDVRQHNSACSGECEKKTLTVVGSRLSFAEQTLPPTCPTPATSVEERHIAISTQQLKTIRLPDSYEDNPQFIEVDMGVGVTLREATDKLTSEFGEYYQPLDIPSSSAITIAGPLLTFGFSRTSFYRRGYFVSHVVSFRFMRAKDGEIIECSPDENSELFYAVPGTLGAGGVVTCIKLKFYRVTAVTGNYPAEIQTEVLEQCTGFERFSAALAKYTSTQDQETYDQGIYGLSQGVAKNQRYIIVGSKTGHRTHETAPGAGWSNGFGPVLRRVFCCGPKFESSDPNFTYCGSMPLYGTPDRLKGALITAAEQLHQWKNFASITNMYFCKGARFVDDPEKYTYYHDGFWYHHEKMYASMVIHHAWVLPSQDPEQLKKFVELVERLKRQYGLCSLLEDYTPVVGVQKFPMAPIREGCGFIFQYSHAIYSRDLEKRKAFCHELTREALKLGVRPLLLKELFADDDVLKAALKDQLQHLHDFRMANDPDKLFRSVLLDRLEQLHTH